MNVVGVLVGDEHRVGDDVGRDERDGDHPDNPGRVAGAGVRVDHGVAASPRRDDITYEGLT